MKVTPENDIEMVLIKEISLFILSQIITNPQTKRLSSFMPIHYLQTRSHLYVPVFCGPPIYYIHKYR